MFNAKPHAAQKPVPIKRSNHLGLTVAGVALGFVCMIPGIAVVGAVGSHLVDRAVNGIKTQDELKARANYYRNAVGAKLGIDPSKVGVREFLMVSRSDPTFSKVVADVKRTEDRSNRESLIINSAVGVLGPVGEVAKVATEGVSFAAKAGKGALELGKMGATVLAGTAASSIFNKDKVSTQEAVERIHQCLLDADAQGKSREGAVTPQLVFLLRVSQDEKLTEEIKQKYGKPYHKLDPKVQEQVMQDPAYTALANAVTSEATALGRGDMQPQDVAAAAPNLNSRAASYRYGGAVPTSFVDAINRQRAHGVTADKVV